MIALLLGLALAQDAKPEPAPSVDEMREDVRDIATEVRELAKWLEDMQNTDEPHTEPATLDTAVPPETDEAGPIEPEEAEPALPEPPA